MSGNTCVLAAYKAADNRLLVRGRPSAARCEIVVVVVVPSVLEYDRDDREEAAAAISVFMPLHLRCAHEYSNASLPDVSGHERGNRRRFSSQKLDFNIPLQGTRYCK